MENKFLAINKKYFNREFKSIELLIIAQIEEFERNNCECYITNEQLSNMFGESISTIKRALSSLETKGIIKRKTSTISNNGQKSKQRILSISKVQNEPNLNQNDVKKSNKQGSNVEQVRFKNEKSKAHNGLIKENKKEKKKDNINNNDFEKIISALSQRGIDTTMEDIINGYKFSRDIKKKPWTVDEMVDFINRESKMGFYDYVNDFSS